MASVVLPSRVLAQTQPRQNPRRPRGLGPRLVVGFAGQDARDAGVQSAARSIAEGSVAGVILLARNIVSVDQVIGLCSFLRAASPDLPPLICVDHEGGLVARANSPAGFSSWLPAEEVGENYPDAESAANYYRPRARELAFAGINLNLGPVIDLNLNPKNPIIGGLGRSYSASPERVVAGAEGFIRAHHEAEVLTCLKHFPGHGSSKGDTHLGPVDVSRTWSMLELEPFRAIVSAGTADSIMNAHLYHPDFSDTVGQPASLSAKSVDQIRNYLRFEGVVMTDDMQMRAVTANYREEQAAVLAVAAGNDLLIYSTFDTPDPDIAQRISGHLSMALEGGHLDRSSFELSTDRVRRLRESLRA
ncbi:glycoside hydrolase family 3 protein [Rhodobacter sp. SY28-1]|uniref:glycoside hydrolase family 3 protein n=1 Tax=Rhodobacter sp. SY28-1 TaxID=2562317 RepID=UPI001485652B|nr:glycoside hydrolase family 3 protein [Rhodobacter sp. SY28-1]